MEFVTEDIIKLMLAVLIGGIIGAEREYRDKSAGFRTLIFICVGSTLFTMISIKVARNSDPARIAAQVVSGVGFLGAGAILRNGGQVVGLTTAAMIWLVAALGMGVGSGNYVLASVGAGVAMVVLWAFPVFEHWIDNTRHTDSYQVICAYRPGRYEELLTLVQQARLKVISSKRGKVDENMIITWVLRGSPNGHADLSAHLLDDPNVKEFRH
jgi:putative Mg2+ transporter-C (MgtC) family protein